MRAPDFQPPEKPPVPIRGLLVLTALIFALTLALRLWSVEPTFPQIKPIGIAAAPFAALFSFGLALILTLAHTNRHRWRMVFWPNRGRVIGAIALALVTPLAIFSWLPSILGGWLVVWVMLATSKELAAALEFFIFSLTFFLLAAALWYPIACLIVSGLTSRWARVAVFSLMYLSAYSAIILVLGTQVFRL